MQIKIVLFVSLALLALLSCAPKPKVEEKIPEAPITEPADKVVEDIGSSVEAVDDLETGLNVDELDKINQDLAELEALEIE